MPGGGVALVRAAPALDSLIVGLTGSARQGAELLQQALMQPLFRIAANCGLDGRAYVGKVATSLNGVASMPAPEASLIWFRPVSSIRQGELLRGTQCGIGRGINPDYTALIAKKPDDFIRRRYRRAAAEQNCSAGPEHRWI